jgi:hypothetical protein
VPAQHVKPLARCGGSGVMRRTAGGKRISQARRESARLALNAKLC